MGGLDNKGERYTWDPRKVNLPPQGFSIGMGGGAHKHEKSISKNKSDKDSSSAKGVEVSIISTDL